MNLKAKMRIKKMDVTGTLIRDIIQVEIEASNGIITQLQIYASEHNKPNTKEQIEFAEAIVSKINEGQNQEIGISKLFIETT